MRIIYLFILLFGVPFSRGASLIASRYDPEQKALLLKAHSILTDFFERQRDELQPANWSSFKDPDNIRASDGADLVTAYLEAINEAQRLIPLRWRVLDILKRLKEGKIGPTRIDEDSKADAIIPESKEVKSSTSFMGNLIPNEENIAFKDLENGDKEEVKESNVTPSLPSRNNSTRTTTVPDTHKPLSTEEESNYGTGSVKISPGKKQNSTIATTGFTGRPSKVVLIGTGLVRDKNLKKEKGIVAPLLNPETLSSHISRTSELQERQNPVLPYQIPIPYVRRANDEPSEPSTPMHPPMLEDYYTVEEEIVMANPKKRETQRNKRDAVDEHTEKLQSEHIPFRFASTLDKLQTTNKETSDELLVNRSPLSSPTEAFERLKTLVDKTVRDLSKFKQRFTLRLIRMTEKDDLARMPEIMKDFQLSSDRPIFFIAGGLKSAQTEEKQTPTTTSTSNSTLKISTTPKSDSPTTAEPPLSTSSSQVPEGESTSEMSLTPTLSDLILSTPLTSLHSLSTTESLVEPNQPKVDESQVSISPVNATNEKGTANSSEISRDETNEEMKARKKRSTLGIEEMEMFPVPGRMARTEDPFEPEYEPYGEKFGFETFPDELMQVRELAGNTWSNQDAISQSHLVEDGDKESVRDSNDVGSESGLSQAVQSDPNPSIVKQFETDSLVDSVVASLQEVKPVEENVKPISIESLSQPLKPEGYIAETPSSSMNLNLINPKPSPSTVENSVILTTSSEEASVESPSTPEKTVVSTLIENSKNNDARPASDSTIGQGDNIDSINELVNVSVDRPSVTDEKVEIAETLPIPVPESLKVPVDSVKIAPPSPVTNTHEVDPIGIPSKLEIPPPTLVDEIVPSIATGTVDIIGDKNIIQFIVSDSKPVETDIIISEEKPLKQEVKVVASDIESINTPIQIVEPSMGIGASSSSAVNIMTADNASPSEVDLLQNQAQPQALNSKVDQISTALLQNPVTPTQKEVMDIKEDISANVPVGPQKSKPVVLQVPEILSSEIPSSTVTLTTNNAPTEDLVKVQDETVVKNKYPVNEASGDAAIASQTQVKPLADSVEQGTLITALPSQTTQIQDTVEVEGNSGTILGSDVPVVITNPKPVALQIPEIISPETLMSAIKEENNNHNTAAVQDNLHLDSAEKVIKDKDAVKGANSATTALDIQSPVIPLVLSGVADKEIVPGEVVSSSSTASTPANLDLLNATPESPTAFDASNPPALNSLPEVTKEQTGESLPEISQQTDLNILKSPTSETVPISPETIVNVPLEVSATDLNDKSPTAHLADLKKPEEQVEISNLNTNEPSSIPGEVTDVIADTGHSKITLSPTATISQEPEKNAPTTINADISSNINKPLESALTELTSGNLETNMPELKPLPSQLSSAGPDTLAASAPDSLPVSPEVVESSSANSISEEDVSSTVSALTAANNPNPTLAQIESNLPIITKKPQIMDSNVGSTVIAGLESTSPQIPLAEQNLPGDSSISLPQKTKPDIDLTSVLHLPLSAPASATIDSGLNQGAGEELTKVPASSNPLSDPEPNNSGVLSITISSPISNQDKKPQEAVNTAIADVQVSVATANDNDPDLLPSVISNISPKPLPTVRPAIHLPQLAIPSVTIPVLPSLRPTVPERPHPVNLPEGGQILSHEHALAVDPNPPIIIPGPTVKPYTTAQISTHKQHQLMHAFFPIFY